MATCLCPTQPCDKHKFPMATKEDWFEAKYVEKSFETITFAQALKEWGVPDIVINEMEET